MRSTSKPLKLGIIGAGFIGQHAHIDNFAKINNCRIVALASGRSELRRKIAQRYNIARTYATHNELLEDREVEAVVAVTARPNIGPVSLDCLKAGKSLLTEKPMASSTEQALRLIDVSKSQQIIYAVGYMRRYDAGIMYAKEILGQLIKSNELGPIMYTRVHCFAGDSYCGCSGHIETNEKKTTTWEAWDIAPTWVPRDQKEEYHQYLNTYGHCINLIRYLFELTPSVLYVQFDKMGAKLAVFDLGKQMAILETGYSSSGEWDERIEIYFAKGIIEITVPPALLKNVSADVKVYKKGELHRGYTPDLEPSWSFFRQAEAFVEDVIGKRESLISAVDSLEDIRITEIMWKMRIKKDNTLNINLEKIREK